MDDHGTAAARSTRPAATGRKVARASIVVVLALGATAVAMWIRRVPTWELTETTRAPGARYESAAASIDGRLYVFGGFDEDLAPVREVLRFDPDDTWHRLADLPSSFNHANAAFDGRDVWLAGGFEGPHPGEAVRAVWKYDVELDEWSPGPELPEKRAGGGLAHVDGALHYFGGYDNNGDPSPGLPAPGERRRMGAPGTDAHAQGPVRRRRA